MGGVFISYRREDSQGEALHLFNDLKERFGIDRIFMDITGIDPGKDFRKVIENAVTTCDVLIVMIGKKWIDAVDEEGKRRLEDPKDLVRIETTAALHRDVPVIPVLVQGAGMPRSEQLPAEIEALAWRNAFELRHNRWSVDVAELVTVLRKIVPGSSPISSEENKSQRWWQTVPGILKMIVGIITGITGLIGLIVALQQPQDSRKKSVLPLDLCQQLGGYAIYIKANNWHGIIGPAGIALQKTGDGSFRFATDIVFSKEMNEDLSADIKGKIAGTCQGGTISFTRKLNGSTQRYSGTISKTPAGALTIAGPFLDDKNNDYRWSGTVDNIIPTK